MTARIQTVTAKLIDSPLPLPADGPPTAENAYVQRYKTFGVYAPTELATLHVTRAEITLDETRMPYAEATLDLAVTDATVFAKLDPKQPTRRVLITLTNTALDGTVLSTRTFDLQLRSKQGDYLTGAVQITAASDDQALDDFKLSDLTYGAAPLGIGIGYLAERIRSTLQVLGPAWTQFAVWNPATGNSTELFYPIEVGGVLDGTNDAVTGRVTSDITAQITIGDSLWDLIQTVASGLGMRLWCDENRKFHLAAQDTNTAGEVYLNTSGTLTELSDEISRDDDLWGDSVVIRYTWKTYDATDGWTSHVGYDAANSHTNTDGNGITIAWGDKVIVVDRLGKPKAGSAAALLARLARRGRSTNPVAICDYAASPGRAFTLAATNRTGTQITQLGIVSSVTFRAPENLMELTTRAVVDGDGRAWLAQHPGVRWSDVPAGVTWATYTNR